MSDGGRPCRAVVISANLNLVGVPDVAAPDADVRSWAWTAPGGSADEERRRLLADAAGKLASFADGDARARAYVEGKAVFTADRQGLVAAIRWLARQVRAADRGLVAAMPSGRDRLLWLELCLLSVALRRPLHVYSEDWVLPTGARHLLRRFRVRALLRAAAVVYVPSDLHAASVRRWGVPGDRVHVIGSIYTGTAAPSAAVDRGDRTSGDGSLLFVGRPMPLKGLDRFLDLVEQLDGVRATVVLGGGDQYAGADHAYEARCRARAAALGDRVRLVERTDDLAALYRSASLLVAPGRVVAGDRVPAESWGRVVEEAVGESLPVVATVAVPAALHLAPTGLVDTVPWDDDGALLAAVRARLGPAGT